MTEPSKDTAFQDFIEAIKPVGGTPAELVRLGDYAARSRVAKRGKVKELGVFTIGMGVILGLLTTWLSYAMQPTLGSEGSVVFPAVSLGIAGVFIVTGILTLRLRARPIILITVSLVALGFILDMLLAVSVVSASLVAGSIFNMFVGCNLVRAVFCSAAIALIIKTGREALAEAEAESSAERRRR